MDTVRDPGTMVVLLWARTRWGRVEIGKLKVKSFRTRDREADSTTKEKITRTKQHRQRVIPNGREGQMSTRIAATIAFDLFGCSFAAQFCNAASL